MSLTRFYSVHSLVAVIWPRIVAKDTQWLKKNWDCDRSPGDGVVTYLSSNVCVVHPMSLLVSLKSEEELIELLETEMAIKNVTD